jgi:hypothetical protein
MGTGQAYASGGSEAIDSWISEDGSRVARMPTLATVRPSRRWGTQICCGLDLGHPPDGERAALDYVTELTRDKRVDPETFARMGRYYSERAICEIVWLVASEHFYNMTNIGLNIHSDMLCDVAKQKVTSAG